jgi:hypothetical protein
MSEKKEPIGTLTFVCVTIAIAQKGQAMDQVSLFPKWPAPKELFKEELLEKKDTFDSPQLITLASNERGAIYVKEALDVNVQCNRVLGINKEMTWNIFDIIVLQKKDYPDQVILYTDLPRPDRNTTKVHTPFNFMVDEGLGGRYVQEVIKLPYTVKALG